MGGVWQPTSFSPAGSEASNCLQRGFLLTAASLGNIKFRVEGIEVLGNQLLLHQPEAFAEPLEVYDFAFPEETDGIADLRILYQPEDVVVCGAGLLLCCQILKQIRNGISLGPELAVRFDSLDFFALNRYNVVNHTSDKKFMCILVQR